MQSHNGQISIGGFQCVMYTLQTLQFYPRNVKSQTCHAIYFDTGKSPKGSKIEPRDTENQTMQERKKKNISIINARVYEMS